jgi:hypothetical protein
MMRFYTRQHRFYCGVDLHARTLALCVLDTAGQVVSRARRFERPVGRNGRVSRAGRETFPVAAFC